MPETAPEPPPSRPKPQTEPEPPPDSQPRRPHTPAQAHPRGAAPQAPLAPESTRALNQKAESAGFNLNLSIRARGGRGRPTGPGPRASPRFRPLAFLGGRLWGAAGPIRPGAAGGAADRPPSKGVA